MGPQADEEAKNSPVRVVEGRGYKNSLTSGVGASAWGFPTLELCCECVQVFARLGLHLPRLG